MVGREADLGRLRALQGASPAPTVALIAGEAGIGKTRLVQELVASAPAGTLVLAGQADPGTVGRPMELFLDALGKTDVSGSPECAAVVKDPSLIAEERVRAAVDLVRSLAGGGPALVVFEDLHWADAESLATFELLAEPERRTARARRHLPPRRPLAAPPRRRPAPPARPAPPRSPTSSSPASAPPR